MNNRWIGIMMVLTLAGMVTSARGGTLDAPAAPTNAASAMFTLNDIYNKLNTRTNVTKRLGGFTEPTAGPTNGTMHTLDHIMTLVTNRAPVPKTGQTVSYTPYDDGWYTTNVGVAWPTNRFTVQSTNTPGDPDQRTNCVLDNLTGLMWARNANLASNASFNADWSSAIGTCTWVQAFDVITNSAGPVNGTLSGPNGYGGYTDWRLPNKRELFSLINDNTYNPALPSGHPFADVQLGANYYWSGTSTADGSDFASSVYAWTMRPYNGYVYAVPKTNCIDYVWPVRGGQ